MYAFTASFIRLPAPVSPSHTVLRPIAPNAGSSAGLAAAGPDASMSSWPCSAGPLLPDTGASTNDTSGRTLRSRSATSMVAGTPIVPICAHTAPLANAVAGPLNMTDDTASAVGSIVITTSAPLTASADDSATRAPAPAGPAVAAADWSQTVVASPAPTRFLAIAEPMMPVPSTATCSRSPRLVEVIGLPPAIQPSPHLVAPYPAEANSDS
ncbi:MAG TPA: hypothetical protein VGH53_18485 [Streptosporangiaceae bacterium]